MYLPIFSQPEWSPPRPPSATRHFPFDWNRTGGALRMASPDKPVAKRRTPTDPPPTETVAAPVPCLQYLPSPPYLRRSMDADAIYVRPMAGRLPTAHPRPLGHGHLSMAGSFMVNQYIHALPMDATPVSVLTSSPLLAATASARVAPFEERIAVVAGPKAHRKYDWSWTGGVITMAWPDKSMDKPWAKHNAPTDLPPTETVAALALAIILKKVSSKLVVGFNEGLLASTTNSASTPVHGC